MRRLAFCFAVLSIACESGPPPGEAQPAIAPPAAVASTRPTAPATSAAIALPEIGEAATAPLPDRPVRAPIGTLDDWIANHSAASAPETFRPPRLRVLADVRGAPRATLAFQRSGHLFRLDLPEGIERKLTDGASGESAPVWTDDGERIFFVSNRDDAKPRVYQMSADGTKVRAVTRALRQGATWTVSRDGARVAYVQGRSPDGIHLVDVVTANDRTVPLDDVQYVSFTRDGATLLVVHGRSSETALVSTVDVETGGVLNLRIPKVAEVGRPWDLGEGRLLVVENGDPSMLGRAPRFATLAIGGGAFHPIGTFDVPIGYLSGQVSPDRKRLAGAWSQRQGGFGAAWFEDVTILDLETGAVRAPRVSRMFPRPFYQAHEPSWAPDNKHLAMTLSICARGDCSPLVRSVVLVDADHPEEVPVFLAEGGQAAFRPEG